MWFRRSQPWSRELEHLQKIREMWARRSLGTPEAAQRLCGNVLIAYELEQGVNALWRWLHAQSYTPAQAVPIMLKTITGLLYESTQGDQSGAREGARLASMMVLQAMEDTIEELKMLKSNEP